jgi:hypothetical protein
VKLEFQLQGDLLAAFVGQFAQVSKAVDQGLDLTTKQTLDFGRVVMRQALGAKAANTIGRKTFEDTGARGIYTRWLQDGQSIPYAFSVGTTIRPKERQFLAVPAPGFEGGELPPGIGQPDAPQGLGRRPIITTGTGRRTAGVRLSPKTFEYLTGRKLRFVPAGHGHKYAMLVLDDARLDKRGRVRGSRAKRNRRTFVVFFLVPQTNLPQQLDWTPVPVFAQDRLEANVGGAIDAALAGGTVDYVVRST